MFLDALIQFPFLRQALAAGLLLSFVAPLVGMFLVVRRYSLLADALSHVSLLGIALGILFKIPPVIAAFILSAAAALGMERLRQGGKVMSEAVIALFLSGSLAFSIVIIGLSRGLNANLLSYLFGSLSTVRLSDVWVLACLTLIVALFLLFNYRSLFLVALDEDLARVSGIRTGILNAVFMIIAALTITAAMQVVGALLVGALMVVPVLTAMQFGLSFRRTLLISVAFSVFSVTFGFYLAYTLDLASGGAIVIMTIFVFCLSSLYHWLLRKF